MKVKAAVAYEGREKFAIEELDLSEPGPDGILVRIVGCGLCHTDVKAREGMGVPKPIVLGHEGAGIVERVGERVTKVKPGDHVVLTYDSCGACRACAGGNPAYCEHTRALNFTDGRSGEPGAFRKGSDPIHGHFFGQSSFSTYAVSRTRNTILVRKDAPLEILGVLGCGVQTGAGAVMNAFQPKPGSTIAIVGAGPVGLSAVMGAVVCGCSTIIAVDVLESRLAMARQLGATHAVLAGPQVKAAEEIRKIVPSGVDYAFDSTGRADSFQQAIGSLAAKGHFGFCAIPAEGLNLSAVMLGGISVRGIVQGDSVPDTFIPRLIDLHLEGRFPFDKLVTKYPFEKINQAIEDQASGRVVKPVFTFPL
ncbi:MAG TPA: NAD(P)-dependent alcohol dehydrogenase [Candidatus Acidoferrales bacterium]|nr:NAD(P)-dependent alcohol dehydrogenase [Candidatus Acidoferrales bacterium]